MGPASFVLTNSLTMRVTSTRDTQLSNMKLSDDVV